MKKRRFRKRFSQLIVKMLGEDFSADDVKKALFQMHPSKSPGVDGFTDGFYQTLGYPW
jgi:hypothetical protein